MRASKKFLDALMRSRLLSPLGAAASSFCDHADLVRDKSAQGSRLLILTEHVNATYFISFDRPLAKCHERAEVDFAVFAQDTIAKLTQRSSIEETFKLLSSFRPELVIFTRYGAKEGPELLRRFKAAGVPTIYHIDDDLLHIPDSLGSEIVARQGNQEVLEARGKMLSEADLIYASTKTLGQTLRERFPTQKVFSGIYASFIELPRSVSAPSPQPVFGYMGSKGHARDLALAVPAIERTLAERPEVRFELFGTISVPPELERFGARVSHHKVFKSYMDFVERLANMGWWFGLAPLENASFNRCKAPTKFVEYTSCGIPTIAQEINVYKDAMPEGTGILISEGGWYEAMNAYLDSSQLREAHLEAAQDHCRTTFGLSRLEEQLKKIIKMVGT